MRKYASYGVLILSFFYLLSFKEGKQPAQNVLTVLTEYFDAEAYEKFDSIISSKDFDESYKHYDCATRGKIQHLIGKYYYTNNEEKIAIRYFKQAAFESWANCDKIDAIEISKTLFNIGLSYHYTNEILEGKKYIDSAFLLISTIPNYPKDLLAVNYHGAGSYYADVPDFLRAETYFKNALSLRDHISVVKSFDINIDLLALYLKFKKYDAALSIFNEIKANYIDGKLTLNPFEKAIYYLNFAEYQFIQKNYNESIANCNQAIKLLSPEDVDYLSNAHEIMGSVYNELKQYELSIQHFETSYKLRMEGQNIISANIAKAYGLENLAELELARKNFKKAIDNINQSMFLISSGLKIDHEHNPILNVKSISNSGQLIRQLYLKNKILFESYYFDKDLKQLKKCVTNFQKIDTLVETLVNTAAFDQSVIKTLENLPDYTNQAINTFSLLYHLTNEAKYMNLSFEFSSKSKSVALKKLAENNKRFNRTTNEKLKTEYTSLSNELNEIQNKIVEQGGDLDSLHKVFSEKQLAMDRLFQKNISLVKENTFEEQLKKLKIKMDDNTAIIDFYAGLDSIYMFLLVKDDLLYRTLSRKTFSSIITELKEGLQNPQQTFNGKLSNSLYTLMLKDFLEKHSSVSNLIFIPNGEVSNFPFEVLQMTDDKYLIEKYTIGYAYHIGMLLNEKREVKPKYAFSGFATNYTDSLHVKIQSRGINNDVSKIKKLVNANAELESCKNIFSEHYFLNSESNLKNFKSYGSQSEILYLSLHAVLDTLDGANSCLVFDDRKEHFLLRSYEFYQQPLSADLVILSSCSSADGDDLKNEGIIGLSRAFLGSGVRSLVSSLWLVSEISSAAILPEFLYNYSSGETKSFALAQAKRKYLNTAPPSQKHPYYWSNFILIADLESQESNSKKAVYWILGIMTVLMVIYFVQKHLKK